MKRSKSHIKLMNAFRRKINGKSMIMRSTHVLFCALLSFLLFEIDVSKELQLD